MTSAALLEQHRSALTGRLRRFLFRPGGAFCAVLFRHGNPARVSPRTGVEAEAIERLTEGVEPPPLHAMLVQCLSGEITPSAAITGLLSATGDVSVVRRVIDEVTRRAAAITRTNDMLVHDRVDDLTQLFVENEAAWQDAIRADPADLPPSQHSVGKSRGRKPEAPSDQQLS